jgi:hypothetical protein
MAIQPPIVTDSESGRMAVFASSTPWPLRVKNTIALQIATRAFAEDAAPIASSLKQVAFLGRSVTFHASKVGR